MATSTPWGAAQTAHKMATGVMSYTTSSHGGIHVSPRLNALIPDYMRIESGWYEEDCDWAIPVIALAGKVELNFESHLEPNSAYYYAYNSLKNWHPDAFEKFFGCTLKEGESYMRDDHLFRERTKNKMVVISALADSKDELIQCTACIGGRDRKGRPCGPLHKYLVPREEYNDNKRGRFPFVIDPEKHQIIY